MDVRAIAAAFVLAALDGGEGMAVHCAGGRGPTGTVIGRVLVRLGHEPDTVVQWLDALHHARGRRGWPEAAFQAQVVRDARNRALPPA